MSRTQQLNQADAVRGEAPDALPVISAAELIAGATDSMVDAVQKACLETGFFAVDLSDLESNPVPIALSQMHRFFALDDQDDRKCSVRSGDDRDGGWVPRFTEPAYQPGTVSNLEAFEFGVASVSSSATGCWPALPGFRADLCGCWHEFDKLGAAILEVVNRAADMPAAFLRRHCQSHELSTMRLLHYEAEAARTDRDVGISAHTDFECITLIYQTAPGLELMDVNGDWLDAPICDGRIVVLLDDMLEHWTNGVFKATGHRVRRSTEKRFSIVMFVAANAGIEIAPLPQFVSDEVPARFPTTTQADHIAEQMRRARANAAAVMS